MKQLFLPLDLEIKLQDNDITSHVHHLVESIPDDAFKSFLRNEGAPAYHPRMMLKIILYAYTQSTFSGRKIEALLKASIRMMWLAEPSYRTINRFRIHPEIKDLIPECFVQFCCHLIEGKLIDQKAIFIDGTKIEVSANKFSFVWKRSVVRYHKNLLEKSNQIYNELLENHILPEIECENNEQLSLEELTQVVQKLIHIVKDYDKQIEISPDVSERRILT